jgi:soluble lytic murein transglycosylase-like protein
MVSKPNMAFVGSERGGWDSAVRVVGGVLALLVAAGALAAAVLALGLGDREALDLRVARIVSGASAAARSSSDPLAWKESRKDEFEARAATGASHVLYAKSPGGATASARRTTRWRDEIEAAAERHDVDPDTLEAIVFLESAGRPDVMAGPTPEAASGLAQIIPSTATDLLGMQVDLPASVALTKQIAKARSAREAAHLRRRRAEVDERFDPAAAIAGAATYLEIADDRFGESELAVESYHMGIGNLESVIRSYLGAGDEEPIGGLVAGEELSYARLYFDSGPDRHRQTYELLRGFGDESSDYLWKVLASEEVMGLYRHDPDQLERTSELATAKATLEEVFHPDDETEVFEEPDDIEAAIRDGDIVTLPNAPGLGWVPDPQMGELAGELDREPELYHALRPEALATLSYMGTKVRELSGAFAPLLVTSTVRDLSYQQLLIGSNPEATDEYSLHTTGWSFDILREYENGSQAAAFQYVLDRLSALAMIDYAVEPAAIHITVSNLGKQLLTD